MTDALIKAARADAAPVKDYCNVLAAQLGLDPGGHAGTFEDAVLIETPLPWRKRPADMTGVLPQEVIALMTQWLDDYHAGMPYNHRPLLIAPDPVDRVEGLRTVIFYARPQQPFACFAKMEYRVPEEALGPLVWAWFKEPDRLPAFDRYRRAEADAMRDLLVCTHGTVDVACAKFGYPLYQMLREGYHDGVSTRVWRVSHFGGHIFAPTLVDMPSGHFWAYVGAEQAEQILNRSGDVAALRRHYRGWAGVDRGFAQAAEREAWQQEGWAWFDYAKSCRVLAASADEEEPGWMALCIDYTRPDGTQGHYAARVDVEQQIYAQPSTGRAASNAYPQYAVTRLTPSAAVPMHVSMQE